VAPRCGAIGAFGIIMSSQDRIEYVQRSDAAEIMDVWSGGSIYFDIP
jgi:hypothetical protein